MRGTGGSTRPLPPSAGAGRRGSRGGWGSSGAAFSRGCARGGGARGRGGGGGGGGRRGARGGGGPRCAGGGGGGARPPAVTSERHARAPRGGDRLTPTPRLAAGAPHRLRACREITRHPRPDAGAVRGPGRAPAHRDRALWKMDAAFVRRR